MNAIDTNVLIYSVDDTELAKGRRINYWRDRTPDRGDPDSDG